MLWLTAVLWTGGLAAQSREVSGTGASDSYLRSLYIPYRDSLDPLFNGREYYASQLKTSGHPYFPENRIMNGSVSLKYQEITGVQLRYNVYRDLLVFVPRDGWLGEIILNSDAIAGFQLEQHRFVHLRAFPPMADNSQKLPPPGYYEALHEGGVALYVKRARRFTENVGGTFDQGEYWEKDSRYLVRNGRTYVIKKKKDLIRALDDSTGELRTFMRKEPFRWSIATDAQFVRLLQFYDTL